MSRPRKDGTPSREPERRNFTDLFVTKVRPEAQAVNFWDTKSPGLVLRVQPTGHRAFKVVYTFRGRSRWYHIGHVPLSDARRIAAKVRLAVAEGKDAAAERKAARGAGTFADLAERYVCEHAKKKNKSWEQAAYLVRAHLLPLWAKLEAKSISRGDVRQAVAKISAPIVANQTLAAASAIFSWAVKQDVIAANPCVGVERHKTTKRERVLSDSELPQFWRAFGDAGLVASSALKLILLTGQRPGEVSHMRLEHIVDGWWELPGMPEPKTGWPGTKNSASHRVWLPQAVRDIIAELSENATIGFVFANSRAKPVEALDDAMRDICKRLGVENKVTPHDLRRTHGSAITRLKFGRDAMNRIQNHVEGGVTDTYDRYHYTEENQKVMETVAAHIMALVTGGEATNVVRLRKD
jgi:integrase